MVHQPSPSLSLWFETLFGPRDGFLTHVWTNSDNKEIRNKDKMSQRWGLDSNNALRHQVPNTALLKHWNNRKPTVEPRWTMQQTFGFDHLTNSFISKASWGLNSDKLACNLRWKQSHRPWSGRKQACRLFQSIYIETNIFITFDDFLKLYRKVRFVCSRC